MTDHSNLHEVRLGALERGVPTYNQTRPVEYHAIGSLTIAAGGAGANYACPGTGTKYDIKGLKLQISCAAVGNNMVGGDALTVYFYQLRDGTYYLLDTKAITTLATAAGSVTKVEVTCDYADTSELHGATHFAIAGNVAVAAGGATGSTVYVDYDLFADEDVALEFSGTIGAVTCDAIGALTDAPVADNTTLEDGTARSVIKLLKRIANLDIAILAKTLLPSAANTARTTATSVLPVQPISAGGKVAYMPEDYYLYDSGDLDVVAGGISGSVDLAGLLDGRRFKNVEISANMVDNADFQYAAATDNYVQLNAKGRSLAGNADGKILAAMLSSAKKSFGAKWNRDVWGSTTARNAYIDSSDTAPYHVHWDMFADYTITYAFKGNGAATFKARFYVKFSN